MLQDLGAIRVSNTYGVGGSQELVEMTFQIGPVTVEVVAETYMGVSVAGPRELVESIERSVQRMMAERG